MSRSSFTTSPTEESAAQSRWESDGGNNGELRASATSHQEELDIPVFISTEQAIMWGSHLNAEQHTKLVKTQRVLSKKALAERSMQRMVDLATQSQLLREAAEAFVPSEHGAI